MAVQPDPTPLETPDPPVARKPKAGKDRLERYEVTKPDGEVVTVEHNLDKGTTEIVSKHKPEKD